jgi:hypothetical protein
MPSTGATTAAETSNGEQNKSELNTQPERNRINLDIESNAIGIEDGNREDESQDIKIGAHNSETSAKAEEGHCQEIETRKVTNHEGFSV